MLIDTHAHLQFPGLVEDLPAVLAAARAAGVGCVIAIGTTAADSDEVVEIATRYEDVYATAGIHPHDADAADAAALEAVERLYDHPRVVGVGEIGLDYVRASASRETQQAVFRHFLRLAKALDRPAVVHNRGATADIERIIVEEDVTRGVLHCFSGDVGFGQRMIDRGWHVSFAGNTTFKNFNAPEILTALPLDRIMVETDAPFLAPQPRRGKRNEPAFVRFTAEHLAAARGMAVAEVEAITTRNAAVFFGVPLPGTPEPAAGGAVRHAG